jgi:DUF2075 family protein
MPLRSFMRFFIFLGRGDFLVANLGSDEMLWMIKPESVTEVGCIHTSQGLEVDYVGVIVGPDFVVRNGEVVTDAFKRASDDTSTYGKIVNER